MIALLRRSLPLLCALVTLLTTAHAVAETPRVYVGVYLHDVTTFDQKNGVFDVDADVWVKWSGDFDPQKVRIANAARVDREPLGQEADGDWRSARWRVRGTLRGEFPLHRFPLDQQTLAIVLELPDKDGLLVPDLAASGVAPRFSITDWLYTPAFHPVVTSVTFPSDLGHLDGEGSPATLQRVGLEVTISRPVRPVVLKLFLPLAIVAAVVLLSLFVHPDSTQPRLTMSVTGLVACFAFQFSVAKLLPDVAYMTLADVMFVVVYFISVVCVLQAVLAHFLVRRDRSAHALMIDRVLRPLLPLITLAVVFNALPGAIPPRVTPPDPVPTLERHATARDVVRIGTTGRLRVASSPPGRASYWPPVYDDPVAGEQVILLERAPRVDNDALRFLADGTVEVEWKLRKDARWSDGTRVTVADFVLPLEASPDPAIVSHRTPNDRTLVLVWKERLARALQAPRLWPAHAVEAKFRAEGFDAVRTHLGEVGVPSTGPYRIVSHDENKIVAEANPHFLAAPPSIRRVEVVRYADADALAGAFVAGKVDITTPNDLPTVRLDALAATRPDVVHQRESASLALLLPNLAHPLLARHDIRAAIVQAIDRERIAREAFGALARVAAAPATGDVVADLATYPFDPAAAAAALEAAGGVGTPMPLTYAAGTPAELLDPIVEGLRAMGFDVTPQEVRSTWGHWREHDHPGLLLHTIRAEADADPLQWWNVPSAGGRWVADAHNPAYTAEIEALITREQRALYDERRAQLRARLLAEWSRRLPAIPLVFADERLLVDPTLRAPKVSAESPFGSGLEKWYFVSKLPLDRPAGPP